MRVPGRCGLSGGSRSLGLGSSVAGAHELFMSQHRLSSALLRSYCIRWPAKQVWLSSLETWEELWSWSLWSVLGPHRHLGQTPFLLSHVRLCSLQCSGANGCTLREQGVLKQVNEPHCPWAFQQLFPEGSGYPAHLSRSGCARLLTQGETH